jgi:large subunit ribosomal protein L15
MRKKRLKNKGQTPKVKPQKETKVKITKVKIRPLAPGEFGLHNLKAPAGACKPKKLLGRGSSSGHGKTSTRGSKGQTSRAGRDFYLGFEGGQTPLMRKIPKRGFVSRNKLEYQIVNLEDLNKLKEPNINLDLLEAKGLIKDKDKLVKILGNGEVKNPITVEAHAFSKQAAEKIKNAGGKVELINAKRTT